MISHCLSRLRSCGHNLFGKHLLNIYGLPDTVVGTGATVINNIWFSGFLHAFESYMFNGRKRMKKRKAMSTKETSKVFYVGPQEGQEGTQGRECQEVVMKAGRHDLSFEIQVGFTSQMEMLKL